MTDESTIRPERTTTNDDTTDMKERERALDILVRNSPGMVYHCRDDEDWSMLYVNDGARGLTGYGSDDFVSKRISYASLIDESDRDRVRSSIREAIAARRPFDIEYRIRTRDRAEKNVREHGAGIFSTDGQLLFLEGFISDVTIQRRTDAALETSERRYREIFEQAPVGIFSTTSDGRALGVNPALARMLGCASPQEAAHHYFDLRNALYVRPERRDEFIARLREHGTVRDFEYEANTADGRRIWISMNARVTERYPDGSFGIEGFATDITERRRAEDALRFSEARLHALVETIPDLIWLKTPGGVYLSCNSMFGRFFGATEEEIVGNTDYDFVEKELADFFLVNDRRAMDAGGPTVNEEWLTFADGGYRGLFETIKTPMRDEGGAIIGVLGIARDITEHKRSEEELREHRSNLEGLVAARTAELEAANSELEAFSYSVSHDLKAPLRAIDGFARFLEEDYADRLDDEGRRLIGIIRNSAREMGQLISDLLAFSRMSRKEFTMSRLDMKAFVRDVWEKTAILREGRDVELRVGDLPEAYGDMATIREVLVNLLSNAIKFTRPREHAVIEVWGREENGQILYSIRDNGAGFDMTYCDRLFNVFQRLHGADEFEGTGIGLALVKRIVRRHGGDVRAEGRPDGGATFAFSLPKAGKRDETGRNDNAMLFAPSKKMSQ